MSEYFQKLVEYVGPNDRTDLIRPPTRHRWARQPGNAETFSAESEISEAESDAMENEPALNVSFDGIWNGSRSKSDEVLGDMASDSTLARSTPERPAGPTRRRGIEETFREIDEKSSSNREPGSRSNTKDSESRRQTSVIEDDSTIRPVLRGSNSEKLNEVGDIQDLAPSENRSLNPQLTPADIKRSTTPASKAPRKLKGTDKPSYLSHSVEEVDRSADAESAIDRTGIRSRNERSLIPKENIKYPGGAVVPALDGQPARSEPSKVGPARPLRGSAKGDSEVKSTTGHETLRPPKVLDQPPSSRRQPEKPRLVIEKLTVEVVSQPPSPPATERPKSRSRLNGPGSATKTMLPSKLRFGLGQM